MGKINDLIQRFKGLFNKNKALPAGEINMIPEQNDFLESLKVSATKEDLNNMPREDAIMKILEAHGLNSKFSKNPESKDQIVNFIKERTSEKLTENYSVKDLQNSIEDMLNNQYTKELVITDTGNLEYSYRSSKKGIRGVDDEFYTKKAFSFQKDASEEDVLAIETTKHSDYLFDQYNPKRCLVRNNTYSIYDKNGVEMSRSFGEAQYSYKTYMDRRAITRQSDLETHDLTCERTEGYLVKRSLDMVTAEYTPYSSIDPNTLRSNGPSPRPIKIDLLMQDPEKLRPKETPSYQKVDAGYVPETKNSKNDIEEYSEKSSRFRKTAESLGLVSRTL